MLIKFRIDSRKPLLKESHYETDIIWSPAYDFRSFSSICLFIRHPQPSKSKPLLPY